MIDLTLPDFLNRKLNPCSVASLEERRAAFPQLVVEISEREAELAERKRQEEEERKQKARERIAQMKQRLTKRFDGKAVGWRNIPANYLGWDSKRLRFYDIRARRARKLAAARERLGLLPGC